MLHKFPISGQLTVEECHQYLHSEPTVYVVATCIVFNAEVLIHECFNAEVLIHECFARVLSHLLRSGFVLLLERQSRWVCRFCQSCTMFIPVTLRRP